MTKKIKEIKPTRKDFITNYPHFRYWKKKTVEEMLDWEPLNIYIHVPFCAQKCAYCYYKTDQYKGPAQLEEYVSALCKEIRLFASRFNVKHRPVHTLYIGGGTPTLLKMGMLEQILTTLKENFTFAQLEFTIEAEPRTIDAKKIAAYKAIGINRISIGIQSFNDEIIRLSGRHHTGEKALKAIETVMAAGDISVNIDLLSGLAGETPQTWEDSIDTAIKTQVHNITIYKLEVYLNTEFFQKSIRHQELELPTEAQELNFMKTAVEKFTAADYKPWSFFTFTRGGEYHHRYASNLWKGEDCCSFGASAFSQMDNYNYQNASMLNSYLAMIKDDKLPIIRAFELTSKDMMIKDILLGMKLYPFNRQLFKEKHGFDFCDVIPETLRQLGAEGYIHLEGHTLTLTSKGILYGDYVGKKLAQALKQYLGMDQLNLF